MQAAKQCRNDAGKAVPTGDAIQQPVLHAHDLDGTGQPGKWDSGVGAGIMYRSPSDKFKCMVSYAYGVNAIRTAGRGASSICFLIQVDLGRFHSSNFSATQPNRWQGWNWLLGR